MTSVPAEIMVLGTEIVTEGITLGVIETSIVFDKTGVVEIQFPEPVISHEITSRLFNALSE